MPLQKRKARAEDEEDAANPNKRRKTVEETQSTSHAASKLEDTDIRLDVVQSQNECENAVPVDEKATQISKPKEIGDSSCDEQSSSSLNFQSVPVTSVDKPKQDTAVACSTQTVPAFKSPSESAVTQPDMVKRNPDSDIKLPASIADQPERTQADSDQGFAKHEEDVEASVAKSADKFKILHSVKAEIAKNNDCIAEMSARTATHSKTSQLNDDSKLTNQLILIESASTSQVAAETDIPRPRSDPDQTDILRLIPATELAEDDAAELSETATQADITHLRKDRAPTANLETITPPTSKEVDMSDKAHLSDTSERESTGQATLLNLRSNFEPSQDAANCSIVGSTLQTVSEFEVSQKSCDLEHEDAVGDVAVYSAITEPQPDKAQESSISEPVTNDDIAESSPEAPSQESNDKEIRQPLKYSRLYRVMSGFENPQVDGIREGKPKRQFSVFEHVSNGSVVSTQYTSTAASWAAAWYFASRRGAAGKQIATIDVRKLEEKGDVEFFDLTDQTTREYHLWTKRARNLARAFEEVLIVGEIPSSCIIQVDRL